MTMRLLGTCLIAGLLLIPAAPLAAAEKEAAKVNVTIYSDASRGDGFAVIRETRKMALKKGRTTLRVDKVAATIDATSVTAKSLTDPLHTSVLEQTFAFDLVSTDKLLERYLDRPLGVVTKDGRTDGTLLSFDERTLVLRTNDANAPVQILARDENLTRLVFGELPGGLLVKPTLVWDVKAEKEGTHEMEVAYQAGGIGWSADYSLVLNEKESAGDFSGWATITNQSGASYEDAGLKLVAGDVQRVNEPRGGVYTARKLRLEGMAAAPDSDAFAEKSFFEYHLYTLPRHTTIAQNSVKQLELFNDAHDVGLRKVLVYYGAQAPAYWWGQLQNDRNLNLPGNTKVDVYVELKNKEDNHLGLPLPKGKVRVFKADPADHSLEFVGEDQIDHTAKDETILLKLGQSFDVVGARKQTDFRNDDKNIRESFEIVLKNHKKEAVTVLVKENLYRWTNWEIEKKSEPFTKTDSRTIQFEVTIPAGGEKKLTYSVHYWGW